MGQSICQLIELPTEILDTICASLSPLETFYDEHGKCGVDEDDGIVEDEDANQEEDDRQDKVEDNVDTTMKKSMAAPTTPTTVANTCYLTMRENRSGSALCTMLTA